MTIRRFLTVGFARINSSYYKFLLILYFSLCDLPLVGELQGLCYFLREEEGGGRKGGKSVSVNSGDRN